MLFWIALAAAHALIVAGLIGRELEKTDREIRAAAYEMNRLSRDVYTIRKGLMGDLMAVEEREGNF